MSFEAPLGACIITDLIHVAAHQPCWRCVDEVEIIYLSPSC